MVTEREACEFLTSASLGILEVNRPHSSRISEASEWALFRRHCLSPPHVNLCPCPASLLNNSFTAPPVSGSRPLFPCPVGISLESFALPPLKAMSAMAFIFFIISVIIITTSDRVSCSPDRLQTCCIARDDLVLLIFLPPLPNC